ncbi:MAG: hypothetical protein ABI723_23375 [Bacteroidia bacterium]
MARQRGNLRIDGTLYDTTFYKMGNHFFSRAKRNVTKEQILNDPKFESTRRNSKEFGTASRAGKLLRDAVMDMYPGAGSSKTAQKVMQLMTALLKLDGANEKGKRNVDNGIKQPASRALVEEFEFNDKCKVSSILRKAYETDTATGKITIDHLVPAKDIKAPESATHFTLKGAYLNIDFDKGIATIEYTNEINLCIDTLVTPIELKPARIPTGAGTKFYLLGIEFFQMVNGVQYEMSKGLALRQAQ